MTTVRPPRLRRNARTNALLVRRISNSRKLKFRTQGSHGNYYARLCVRRRRYCAYVFYGQRVENFGREMFFFFLNHSYNMRDTRTRRTTRRRAPPFRNRRATRLSLQTCTSTIVRHISPLLLQFSFFLC